MAEEALAKAGLHFDELNKIRVLEPEVAQQTGELKEECKDFLDSRWSWSWNMLNNTSNRAFFQTVLPLFSMYMCSECLPGVMSALGRTVYSDQSTIITPIL